MTPFPSVSPVDPAPLGIAAAPIPSVGAHDMDADDGDDDGETPAPRRTGLILGGAAVIALAIGGGAWMGLSSSGGSQDRGVEAVSDTPVVAEEKATLFAAAQANLRDKPSLQGSQVVGSLKRGEKVSGILVTEDGSARQWLKIDGSGRFVSLANLTKLEPAVLAALDGSDRIISAPCTVLESAAFGSPIKTSLKSGAPVRIIGATADGFTEYGLPGGGIGYAPGSAECATTPSRVKGAVANNLIKFDASDCNFGPELEPYYEEGRKLRQASGPEGEAEEFLVPVEKTFHGLRVKMAISGYEWHGVSFADPLSKVQAVFRELGYKIDKDGNFEVGEDTPVFSSLTATDASMAARGKSQLICGV